MRLLAVALGLLAAGAAVIGVASALVAASYLTRQADQQLRSYADRLTGRRFMVEPAYGLGSGGLSADGADAGALGIEVRGAGGEVVLRAGLGTRLAPAIPPISTRTAARAGELVTVSADRGGGRWAVIPEPIRYRVRRIPYAYSADDFAVFITGPARAGLPGTLVVGLDLGGISHAADGLTVTSLVAGGVAILAVAVLGAMLLGVILRPIARMRQTAAAVAAGELSRRVPERYPGCEAGGLVASFNTMLSRIERELATRAGPQQAARGSGDQIARVLTETGRELRRSVSVIRGFPDNWRRRGPLRAGELDRMMRQMADEAARMEALVDDLRPTPPDQPPR